MRLKSSLDEDIRALDNLDEERMLEALNVEFRGTARFRIERRLGKGGFGEVYKALDTKSGTWIAIKTTLRELYRFKHEFRSMSDIRHRNLVRLYELFEEPRWFFTMELIDGVSFIEYVRGGLTGAMDSGLSCDLSILQTALLQLLDGLQALHKAGKLHRDIKPANVLVTREGRVVLLDFGLITEAGPGQSTSVVGTWDYMAPEQAAGEEVGPSSDLYSVGIMIYEALTGVLPFTGSVDQVRQCKQRLDPLPPRQLVPIIPRVWDEVCLGLLRRDPEARLSADEIRNLVGGPASRTAPLLSRGQDTFSTKEEFIGRNDQLATLRHAFLETKARQASVCLVHGDSGMGKSTLIRHFLQSLPAQELGVVVLEGRCYDREFIRHRALDSILDALSRYLGRLPSAEVNEYMPVDAWLLACRFEVLKQVPVIQRAGTRFQEDYDTSKQRRRALLALRELLVRLAARRPLVLAIDDAQWGDAEDAAILEVVLGQADPPALLLLACYRNEDSAASPFLRDFLRALPGLGPRVHDVPMEALEPAEARALALRLMNEISQQASRRAEDIARESAGNPFFISELVERKAEGFSLQQTIENKLQNLSADARSLLHILALAGCPLDVETARRAAGLSPHCPVEHEVLPVLRSSRLVRTRYLQDRRTDHEIELYHDRIRQTALATLSSEVLRGLHLSLAKTLQDIGQADPETLAVHFQAAGETAQAAKYAYLAGQNADMVLAFDRAARLYRMAVGLHPMEGANRQDLLLHLGQSLANAGRGAEAARVFLDAAEISAPGGLGPLELKRRAAEQLLWSGHMDEGVEIVRDVLNTMGMSLPVTPTRTLLALLLRRAQLRLRGLRFRQRPANEVQPDILNNLDTCWSIAVGLSFGDPIQAANIQTQHLLFALRCGEPGRIARGLAFEGAFCATSSKDRHRSKKLLNLGRDLAEQSKDPHVLGLIELTTGIATFLAGGWRNAQRHLAKVEEMLKRVRTGVAWELDTARLYGLHCLYYLGELDQLATRLPELLTDAEDRGDLYALTHLYSGAWYVACLAADQPDRAEQGAEQAMAKLSGQRFLVPHWQNLWGQVDTSIYQGDPMTAWHHIDRMWPALQNSLLLRIQHLFILSFYLRSRGALALAACSNAPQPLLRIAEHCARKMERERTLWGNSLALLVHAGIADIRGHKEEAIGLLTKAQIGLEKADIVLTAAAACYRRGQLFGGDEGGRLMETAKARLLKERIKNPERMIAVLATGRWQSGGRPAPV